ncbi:MAG: META domain-containing protein [Caldilinea sp.]|nr:META domain-containing protein [Caldilinea sp.]MDW8441621.1 META domain-containing protein [Caldilineaceae bacterium]
MQKTSIFQAILLIGGFMVAALLFGACQSVAPPEPSGPQTKATPAFEEPDMAGKENVGEGVTEGEPTLEGVIWHIVEYLGADAALNETVADATITFQGGQVAGNSGCNSFFADYALAGQQLTIAQVGSTLMMCEESIMAQEQAILAALGKVAAYAPKDDGVALLDASGAVVLTLAPQPQASLTGVVWVATTVNSGRQAVVSLLEGTEMTAVFDEEGMLFGSAGCNNYRTSYTLDGDTIALAPIISTRKFCSEPEGVMEQEANYLAALKTVATWSIRGDVLELRDANGALAVSFRASRTPD